MPTGDPLLWSDEFVLLDMEAPVLHLLELLVQDGPYYVLLRGADLRFYVFVGEELRRFPGIRKFEFVTPPAELAIEEAIELPRSEASRSVGVDGGPFPGGDAEAEAGGVLPSRDRWVAIDPSGTPVAVGEAPDRRTLGGARPPQPIDLERFTPTGSPPPRSVPRMEAVADEGTDPVRYPSLQADGDLAPGKGVAIVVDLLREPLDPETDSVGVSFQDLPADWQDVDVGVEVLCSAIRFQATEGIVKVRRNENSEAAVFHGTVDAGVEPGQRIRITAIFSFEDRDCGIARRTWVAGAQGSGGEVAGASAPLVVERRVEPPVLTVRILRTDPAAPGKLLWSLVVPRADLVPGLPRKLAETIDLGADPKGFVAELYGAFAGLGIGAHVEVFRGCGDQLWQRAPESFRRTYWALRAALGPSFTIQFITDDPHVPWELMRPSEDDTGEVGEILALGHPVARWIGAYEGTLRQHLGEGRVATIAPRYPSVMDELPRAQEEADLLTARYRALPIAGTMASVRDLLQQGAEEPLAILHFAGHGEFPPGLPANATIKLEDGSMSAMAVGARETTLGERDGPLVVFNACKVGATGEALGASGGWADVFLERRFRGFVAPLWPVYDDDAALVVSEFFEALVKDRKPVGRVLQELRARHAARSPTFFAYLYYGDVNARLPGRVTGT